MPDTLRGTGLNFLILDEFADIDKRAWFEVFRASISDTLGNVLMCGTPKGYGNWSYEMYLKGKQDDEWDSFQYTTLDGGMVTPKEIDQAKQDLDKEHLDKSLREHLKIMLVLFITIFPVDNVVNKKLDWQKPLHIGMDFNIDPMSACVAQIEKDKDIFCR